jgi:hypothetical protein
MPNFLSVRPSRSAASIRDAFSSERPRGFCAPISGRYLAPPRQALGPMPLPKGCPYIPR